MKRYDGDRVLSIPPGSARTFPSRIPKRACHRIVPRQNSLLPPVKILVAPDKFKGSLSAVEAVAAITRGWQAVRPGDFLEPAPIADGGEGFAAALQLALGGEWV